MPRGDTAYNDNAIIDGNTVIDGIWDGAENRPKNNVENGQVDVFDKVDESIYNNDILYFLDSMKSTNVSTITSQMRKVKQHDIETYKSVGAKSKNYDIMDLTTGEMFRFVEGTKIQNVEVFAGKDTDIRYRNAEKYAKKYGGNVEDWQHVKGIGWLETVDGDIKAEVHWSQCKNVGKFDFFVKRWLE